MNIKSKEKSKKPERRTAKKITETYLHNAGLYYLQRFSSSTQRFRDIMLRKIKKSCAHHEEQDYEECAQMLETLIKKFQHIELLNDASYAEASINTLRRQGKSARAIQSKLQQKGIPYDLVAQKLNQYDENQKETSSEIELKAAQTLTRKKKLGLFRTKTDYDPQKELQALARAGFSYDIAKKALKI